MEEAFRVVKESVYSVVGTSRTYFCPANMHLTGSLAPHGGTFSLSHAEGRHVPCSVTAPGGGKSAIQVYLLPLTLDLKQEISISETR